MRSAFAVCLLAALSVLYGVAELVPGRFTATDEVFFKAAGRNWAATGHFAAPEIVGRLQSGPPLTDVYFAQPPVYTFLFGLYTKAAGFGPRRCMVFDVLIHLFLVWTAVACARRVFKLPVSLAILSGVLILPLGTIGRPDELAISIAFWAAVAFASNPFAAGILLGLCAAASLTAPVFLGGLILWEVFKTNCAKPAALRLICAALAIAFATFAACIAPILIHHPTAYQQLFAHAAEQSPIFAVIGRDQISGSHGIARALQESLRTWREMSHFGFGYIVLILGIFSFAAIAWAIHRPRRDVRFDRYLVGGLLSGSIVIILAGKYFYFWFIAAWLLIASVELASQVCASPSKRGKYALLSAGITVWVASSLPYIQQKAITWTISKDQSLDANYARVRSLIPAGDGVLSTDFWWMLADRDRVYDTLFSDPAVSELDYIVLSGNGSGIPAKPTAIKQKYSTGEFQPVYDHLNRTPASLFGERISHSAYGFGAYVLKRTSPDSTR